MQLDLNNKNAIVCGSTQGIGKATALALAAANANVTLVARDAQRLADVQDELSVDAGQHHSFVVADFANPGELASKINAHLAESGPCSILVNNTGGPPGGDITDATIAAFEAAFTQHLKCNHLLAQAVVPGMKTQKFGRIINVISTSVKQPLNGLGVSNTIRGAVASWAKTMANELGPWGITVNNVLPGATATERLATIIAAQSEKQGLSIEAVTAAMKASIPARRFAEPAEIANAILFLASEPASYINGVNLPVDGGRTKCL